MIFSFTGAGPTSSASLPISGPSDPWVTPAFHAYASGTFGSGGAMQIQYSPDTVNVADGASRWFAPTALAFTASGDTWFQVRAKKIRVTLAGGDASTSLTLEII